MPETTITNLPDGQTPGVSATRPLSGTERVPMDQGATTVDATTQDIADLAGAAITTAVDAHEAAADPHPGYLLENDSSVTNARTPTAHAGSHATGGSDALTPAAIGAATIAQGALADAAVQPGDPLTGLGSGAATAAQVPVADGAGGISWADQSGAGGATNLSYTAATRLLESSTGADVTLPLADGVDAGLMAAADFTKLAGIEAGATADQTGAEIKAAYEAEANTNAFTDAEQTKLAGIEAGADVTDAANVTAAGALMDTEVANLAQVKAFSSADYATAAQGSLADSALQPAGAATLTNKTLGDLKELTSSVADAGATEALDPLAGPLLSITLTEACEFTVAGWVDGQSQKLRVDGDFAITWTGVVWVGDTPGSSGTAPAGPGAGFLHVELWKEAGIVYGSLVGYSAT